METTTKTQTQTQTQTQTTVDPFLPLVTFAKIEMFRQARVMNGFNFPDNQHVDYWVNNGILTFQYIDRIDRLTQFDGEPIEEDRHSYMTINLLENARIEQLYDKLQQVFEVIEEHEVYYNTLK
jgi:hypothetical protein